MNNNNLLLARTKKLILVNELFIKTEELKKSEELELLIKNQNFVLKHFEIITQSHKLVLGYCLYGIINKYPNLQKQSDELIESSREKIVITLQLIILSKLSMIPFSVKQVTNGYSKSA